MAWVDPEERARRKLHRALRINDNLDRPRPAPAVFPFPSHRTLEEIAKGVYPTVRVIPASGLVWAPEGR